MELVVWTKALEGCAHDKEAGIKIAKLCGNTDFSTFLTSIEPGKSVNPHYHKQGVEHYHIIEGKGEIELIDVRTKNSTLDVVGKNCSFVVEPNKIHRLKNIGEAPLVLMFSCPESHLTTDRYLS